MLEQFPKKPAIDVIYGDTIEIQHTFVTKEQTPLSQPFRYDGKVYQFFRSNRYVNLNVGLIIGGSTVEEHYPEDMSLKYYYGALLPPHESQYIEGTPEYIEFLSPESLEGFYWKLTSPPYNLNYISSHAVLSVARVHHLETIGLNGDGSMYETPYPLPTYTIQTDDVSGYIQPKQGFAAYVSTFEGKEPPQLYATYRVGGGEALYEAFPFISGIAPLLASALVLGGALTMVTADADSGRWFKK